MSTIQVKGFYKTIQNFIEKGVGISNNNIKNHKVFIFVAFLIKFGIIIFIARK